MMYNNKMVVVIKVNGKILREVNDVVYIPFGSEYEISLKNLHTTRAGVKISIDGTDVLDGRRLVLDPDGTSSVEGFMKGNAVSHKFKFIEKTQEISDYRGDLISDGLIRVEFCFEQQIDIRTPILYRDNTKYYTNNTSMSDYVFSKSVGANYSFGAPRSLASVAPTPQSDAGITVKGSESNQKFSSTSLGIMETVTHSMVIQLKGQVGDNVVSAPLLVKTKVKCDTCGHTSSSFTKFCGNCGTSLVI